MNTAGKRLKVLFLAHPLHLREPWLNDLRQAIGPRHNIVLLDEQAPLAKQFAGVDVVVDQGGVHGTRAMADSAESVKLWQILGTGFEKFDLEYWRQKRIPVANTPGQFSAAAFERMKPTSLLINTSRGLVIDEQALLQALNDGSIAGAGLDVLSTEPPSPQNPLLLHPRTIVTPHAAFYSEESVLELQTTAACQMAEALSGRRPPNIVNPDVLRRSNLRTQF
jgi:phosphoglycerate dehydrogenase-like enzyme